MAQLGIRKVRLTGGEPTLRPDVVRIAEEISRTAGIQKIALTTNGYRLPEIADDLKKAGITSLNVSVDSLKPDIFFRITGQDRFHEVMAGIAAAKKAGFTRLKINTVVMKDTNETEIDDFIGWAQEQELEVRFIELMPIGDQPDFFKQRHFDLSPLPERLLNHGWTQSERDRDSGPADVWSRRGTNARIGLIRALAKNFCDSCNRLRVTSQGDLQLCLFGKGNVSLRPWLQHDEQLAELTHNIRSYLGAKEPSHHLHEGDYGTTRNLATMGG